MALNNGPKTDPCGTPCVSVNTDELISFMLVYYFLLLPNEWNSLWGIPLIP